MGDRRIAEIKTEGGSLYFYTHYFGAELLDIAKEAMEKAQPRSKHYPYATRIVIDQLIKYAGGRDQETGSGIMLKPNAEDEYNNDKPSVIIDLINNKVSEIKS